MVDVFISYSRPDQSKVAMLARQIAAEGYDVWWDQDLPPHLSYGDVITAKITEARAAVVVWSETAAQSEWVRAEADVARNQKKLIQVASDGFVPPLPFNQIQCASLSGWRGEPDHPGWIKVKESLAALCQGERAATATGADARPAAKAPPRPQSPPRNPSRPGGSSNANVLIGLGIGGFLMLCLLGVLAEMSSVETPADPDFVVIQPTESPAIGSAQPPVAAPTAAAPSQQVEDAAISLSESGNLRPDGMQATATVISPAGTYFYVVDANFEPTGEASVLPGGANVLVLHRTEELWLVQRVDGSYGIVDPAAMQLDSSE